MSPTQQTTSLEKPSILDGTRRHVLDLDDFSAEELDLVLRTTDEMREVLGQDVKKITTLRGKVVITLFYEASTRTRASPLPVVQYARSTDGSRGSAQV